MTALTASDSSDVESEEIPSVVDPRHFLQILCEKGSPPPFSVAAKELKRDAAIVNNLDDEEDDDVGVVV